MPGRPTLPIHAHGIDDLPIGTGPGQIPLATDVPGLVPAGGGVEEQVYGSTLLVPETQAYPLGAMTTPLPPYDAANTQAIYNARGVGLPDMIQSYDAHYSRCLCDVRVISAGGAVTVYTGLTFANRAAIIAWVNANVPNDGSAFTATARATFYDRIDRTIRPITRLTGVNGVMQRTAKEPDISPEDWNTHIGSNLGREFFRSLWLAAHGIAFPYAAADPIWTDSHSAYGVFWWTRLDRKIKWRTCWEHPNYSIGGSRIFGGVVAPQALGAHWTFGTPVYGAISPDGLNVRVSDPGESLLSVGRNELAEVQWMGWSAVIAVPADDGVGGTAIRMVPCGLDTFYTSWFDETTHRLEAFGADEKFGDGKLRVLSTGHAGWKKGDLIGPYPLSDFAGIPFGSGRTGFDHRGAFHDPGTIRFQLRDLATNRISPLSDQEVYFRRRERWWEYQPFVRTRKR